MSLPIVFENSRIPDFLSKFVPIKIHAISFGPFIFCRDVLSTRTRQHEIIHYRQQLELLFVAQWFLYGLFWLLLLLRYRDGRAAYRNNPFECEAYDNDIDPHYLEERKPFAWVRYFLLDRKEP